MLYAIRIENGPIKIGRAKNPAHRLESFKVASPFEMRLLAQVDWHDQNEEIIHHALRHSYIRGEWFEPTDDVLEIVGYMKNDDFNGICKKIGRCYSMPKFDKKKYQKDYMAVRRAVKAGRAMPWRPRGA